MPTPLPDHILIPPCTPREMWLTSIKSWKPGWGEIGMKKQQTHTEKQGQAGCKAYSDGGTNMKPRNSGSIRERRQLVSVAGLWKSSLNNFPLSRKLIYTIYTLALANGIHWSIILEPKDGFVISIDLMHSWYWYGCSPVSNTHSLRLPPLTTDRDEECQLDFQYNPQVGIRDTGTVLQHQGRTHPESDSRPPAFPVFTQPTLTEPLSWSEQ